MRKNEQANPLRFKGSGAAWTAPPRQRRSTPPAAAAPPSASCPGPQTRILLARHVLKLLIFFTNLFHAASLLLTASNTTAARVRRRRRRRRPSGGPAGQPAGSWACHILVEVIDYAACIHVGTTWPAGSWPSHRWRPDPSSTLSNQATVPCTADPSSPLEDVDIASSPSLVSQATHSARRHTSSSGVHLARLLPAPGCRPPGGSTSAPLAVRCKTSPAVFPARVSDDGRSDITCTCAAPPLPGARWYAAAAAAAAAAAEPGQQRPSWPAGVGPHKDRPTNAIAGSRFASAPALSPSDPRAQP